MSDKRSPFDQLKRCHRRLEEACDALSIASADHDVATILDVRRFLDRQIKRHEEDEDESLFPRLLKRSGSEAAATTTAIARLTKEHREHEALHAELSRLTDAPEPVWPDVERVADKIVQSYRAHIEVEEKELFPQAEQVLDQAELDQMHDEMRARRDKHE